MIQIAVDKTTWGLGLFWQSVPSAGTPAPASRRWFQRSGSANDANRIKQLAAQERAPGVALHGDLYGLPGKGVRLRGKVCAGAPALAEAIGGGVLLARVGKFLYLLLAAPGRLYPGCELLLPADGDAQLEEALQTAAREMREFEQFVLNAAGGTLPLWVEREPSLQQSAAFAALSAERTAHPIRLGEILAGVKQPNRYRLLVVNQAQKAGGKGIAQVALLAACASGAAWIFSDSLKELVPIEWQFWKPAPPPVVAPRAPDPRQLYLAALQTSLASTLNAQPVSLARAWAAIGPLPDKQQGWRLSKITCKKGQCVYDRKRGVGGRPSGAWPAVVDTVDHAQGSVAYRVEPATIGLDGKPRWPVKVDPTATEAVLKNTVYPTLMALTDIGYQVTLGAAAPLVDTPLPGAPRLMKRTLVVEGSARGEGGVPTLIDALSRLPRNVSVNSLTYTVANAEQGDQLAVDCTIVYEAQP